MIARQGDADTNLGRLGNAGAPAAVPNPATAPAPAVTFPAARVTLPGQSAYLVGLPAAPANSAPGANPNAGRFYNGFPIFDLGYFNDQVANRLLSTAPGAVCLPAVGYNVLNIMPSMPNNGRTEWSLYQARQPGFLIPPNNLNWMQDTGTDQGAYDQASDAGVMGPNAIFYFEGPDQSGQDTDRQRVRAFYYRKGNVAICLGSQSFYKPSGWVDMRSGIIFVVGIVFSAVGAPVLSASATGVVAGDTSITISTLASGAGQVTGNQYLGLAGKALNLAVGNVSSAPTDAVTTTAEETTVDDIFDPANYSNPFDGFNFSSGEADVAFSDAQNVDFGFATNPDFLNPNDVNGLDTNFFANELNGDGNLNFNGVPEVTTSDFGVVPNFDFANVDTDLLKGAVAAVPLATQTAALLKPQQGQQASSGATGAKSNAVAQGSNDVLSTVGSVLQSAAQGAAAIAKAGGVASQLQGQNQTFTGQLTPTGGAAAGIAGMNMNTLMLIGGGLLIVALVLHAK